MMGSSPCLMARIEIKFLSGLAMLTVPTDFPLSPATVPMPDSCVVIKRMQPPWIAAVSFTSKPCSSGFIQASAMPTPTSALDRKSVV